LTLFEQQRETFKVSEQNKPQQTGHVKSGKLDFGVVLALAGC